MSLLSEMMVRRGNVSPTYPWTEAYIHTGINVPRFIAADSTTFVIVFDKGYISTSSDPTNSYTASTNNVGSNVSFVSSCNSYWLSGAAGIKTASSATGVWTTRLTLSGSDEFCDAIYSTTASLYIAVGENGLLYTASDPTLTWTSRTSQFGTTTVSRIHDNGSLIVIVGESGKMATSTDGITWTLRTSGFGTSNIYGATYGGTSWVFVGGDSKVGTSSDPTTSVTINTSTGITSGLNLYDIAFSGTDFVIVADASRVLKAFETTSPSGAWTEKIVGDSFLSPRIASNNSYFGVVSPGVRAGKAYGRTA